MLTSISSGLNCVLADSTHSCQRVAKPQLKALSILDCPPRSRVFFNHQIAEPRQPARAAADAASKTTEEDVPTTSGQDRAFDAIPLSDTWELDFSSRPVLDERGKKKWELLICSPDRSWQYAKYFPNNKINSTQLRIALDEILSQEGAVYPKVVKFFRAQMQTIITRALKDLNIKGVPSRRCFSLMRWLEERLETIYKKDANFNDKASSLFMLDLGPPEKLPDALRGEKWSFVQLPYSALQEELKTVEAGQMFGDYIHLREAGISELLPETMIPGVAVYSIRAMPLSAWTKGYDLANLTADPERACLVLETGVNQRWRYASFRRTAENMEEASAWQAAKQRCRGLHFLAVQKDEEAEQCNGLWLMMDRSLPDI